MKCAIVTIAMGDDYIKQYEKIFKRHTEAYCNKYGYDFILLTDWLFEEKYRSYPFVNIQKWAIPFMEKIQKYDRIAIVDADIIITPNCPPIESLPLGDKIGVVNEYQQPSFEQRTNIAKMNGWEKDVPDYYNIHLKERFNTDIIFNGGLIICSPRLHGSFFKNILEKHIDGTFTAPSHPFHFEQANLSRELIINDMYYILDNTWNMIIYLWLYGRQNRELIHNLLHENSYCIHYVAHSHWDLAEKIK
jgi:lipopolysaccharide biosynthesis glycosyltransferase